MFVRHKLRQSHKRHFAMRPVSFVLRTKLLRESRKRDRGKGERGEAECKGKDFYLFISLGFTPNSSENTLLKWERFLNPVR